MKCKYCGDDPCDNDCGELQAIYREQQREKLRDIVFQHDERCEVCRGYCDSEWGVCSQCQLDAMYD